MKAAFAWAVSLALFAATGDTTTVPFKETTSLRHEAQEKGILIEIVVKRQLHYF